MASTPEVNENFLREVDDELRRDQATKFWRRWGVAIVALIVAGLLALGGYLYWQHRQTETRGLEGERLSSAINSLETGNSTAATPVFTELEKSESEGTRASAKLALAALAVEKNDLAGAARIYGEIAADTSLEQPFRDAALVRQVAVQYDSLPPAQVVDRLRGLAVPGNPWFGSAGEMTAIALMRMNQNQQAGQLFAAIARDETVPQTLRSRAIQLAGVLGVDATPVPTKVN